jgi:cobalt-zinc-cadmium resistance protein CzcA
MLSRLIAFAVSSRWIIVGLTIVFLIFGGLLVTRIPVDAFPDLTNNQVVITTEAPSMPPTEVDQLITFPLQSSLMGLPNTEILRSMSKLGLSMITVVFDDSVDTYFARQVVNERIQQARSRLPQGLEPTMGPIATAFGEVYQYTLDGPMPLMERKTLHDWQIRYQLRNVPGISDINSWGGLTKRYNVQPDPNALQKYNLTLHDVAMRLENNNMNFGGGFVNYGDEQYTVLGLGRAVGTQDLGAIPLFSKGGTPVLMRDVASINIGSIPRQGSVSRDGKGETLSGMVIAMKGANGLRVIENVKDEISNLNVPKGLKIRPFYDQSEVIYGTIHTVRKNLLEASLLVMGVLLLFLGNLRAALIVAFVIPLAMLFGFVGMSLFGVSANLMSLGAIDFGMIVDGAVVMMENSVRKISESRGHGNTESIISQAGAEVARPIVFGVAIIIAVYLPIFFLQDLEGRLFRPMAVTVCSALIGSLILALTVVPAFGSLLLRNAKEHEAHWFDVLIHAYRKSLDWVLLRRKMAIGVAVAVVLCALGSLAFVGTEFMPRLDEGSLLITTKKLPGISLPQSISISQKIERMLMSFPEITSVTTKLGRPDLATEAMSVYEADVYVQLKPRSEWKTAPDRVGLVNAMAKKLETIPGVAYNFTQPMAMRMDEVVTGIKGDIAVKVFGEDPAVLQDLSDRVLRVLQQTPGSADAQAEVVTGVPELHIAVDRQAIARYGVDVSDVRELVEAATGGLQVSESIEGQRRFPIAIWLPASSRTDVSALGNLSMRTRDGELIRLNQIAQPSTTLGPETVLRENTRQRMAVQCNVRGTDLGSFVKAAQARMAQQVHLPAGYTMTWGGQFENQQRAEKRLAVVLPVSLAIIFLLLYSTFHSVKESFLILLAVPFALVGGIGALWIRGLNLNLSASIGFIALFGVAVLNGIVMVSYINHLRDSGKSLDEAVRIGAGLRLRPVLMTALVASLGFLPMAFSTSQGSEVQRPLATVVIGGLISATVLTLYLIPAAYPWFARKSRALYEDEIGEKLNLELHV